MLVDWDFAVPLGKLHPKLASMAEARLNSWMQDRNEAFSQFFMGTAYSAAPNQHLGINPSSGCDIISTLFTLLPGRPWDVLNLVPFLENDMQVNIWIKCGI